MCLCRPVGRRDLHEGVRGEWGLDKSGIRPIRDDDLLANIGYSALGAVTTHHSSAAHDLPENKAFVEAFEKANNGMAAEFFTVGAYDGMALVYKALETTRATQAATRCWRR